MIVCRENIESNDMNHVEKYILILHDDPVPASFNCRSLMYQASKLFRGWHNHICKISLQHILTLLSYTFENDAISFQLTLSVLEWRGKSRVLFFIFLSSPFFRDRRRGIYQYC